jgi:hypothetical protein
MRNLRERRNDMSIRRGSRIALSIVEIHKEIGKQAKLSLSELMKRIQSRRPNIDINEIHEGIKFAEDIQLIELQTEGEEIMVIFYPLGDVENGE